MENELLRLTQRVIADEAEIQTLKNKLSEQGAFIQGLQSLQGKFLKDLEASNARIYKLEQKPVDKPLLVQNDKGEIKPLKPSFWDRFK